VHETTVTDLLASATAPAEVNILLVDDRPANLIALEAVLSTPGHRLVKASSGKEALERVREQDFAVILLDVQMPEMDGFATARLIRQEPGSSATPIIFVTANHDSATYEQKGYAAGAVDYLLKPFNPDILAAKVAVFAELQRKNEEIRRQAKLIHARDEFLSIASHELKTPLTPLSLQMESFISLLDRDGLGKVPRERLERMLKNANSQVERLTRLVNELLDVSRITAGRLTLRREPVDLRSVVQSVVEAFAVGARKAGCELTVRCEGHVAGNWDRFRLEQVVINLMTNALKYGKGKPVEIAVKGYERSVRLSVRDQGIGIAPADQARIFERFERAVSAQNFGGLGLGLYIVGQIVKLHQGTITVESHPGEGACFEVSLPRA
jgi:signal transduction histidine kinase